MANQKVTDLAALTTPADGDILYIVDVSDTSGGAAGTSKKIVKRDVSTVQTVKVSIANAAILTMKYDNTPVTLKDAVASKIIVPVSCVCVATHAGSNESSSDDLRIGWNAASSTTVDYWGTSRDWMNGVSSGAISTCFGGTDSASSGHIMTFTLTNTPFQIWCSDNFNGGWSMDVYFSYYTVDA